MRFTSSAGTVVPVGLFGVQRKESLASFAPSINASTSIVKSSFDWMFTISADAAFAASPYTENVGAATATLSPGATTTRMTVSITPSIPEPDTTTGASYILRRIASRIFADDGSGYLFMYASASCAVLRMAGDGSNGFSLEANRAILSNPVSLAMSDADAA